MKYLFNIQKIWKTQKPWLDHNHNQFYVVINGNRRPKEAKKLQLILENEVGADFFFSTDANDFERLIHDFFHSKRKYLIIFGGDGSIHKAIDIGCKFYLNALQKQEKIFGFLRGGSGNGYHDSYGLPNGIATQILWIVDKVRKESYIHTSIIKLDYFTEEAGKLIKEQCFGQLLGIGYDAEIVRQRNNVKLKTGDNKGSILPGKLSYAWQGVLLGLRHSVKMIKRNKLFLSFPHARQRIVDKEEHAQIKEFANLNIERTPLILEMGVRHYFAANFAICPHANPENDHAVVYNYNFKNPIRKIYQLKSLWQGDIKKILAWDNKLKRKHSIEIFETKSISIQSETPFYAHIDGEIIHINGINLDGKYELRCQVLPKVLSILNGE